MLTKFLLYSLVIALIPGLTLSAFAQELKPNDAHNFSSEQLTDRAIQRRCVRSPRALGHAGS